MQSSGGLRQWWNRRRKRTKIGLVGCASLILLSLCICSVSAVIAAGQSSNTGVTSAARPTTTIAPTVQATLTHIPTLTATPTLLLSSGPALLAANIGTFDAHYGSPDVHSDAKNGQYHYQKYSDSNIDFLIVNTDPFDGAAYSQLVYSVGVQADDTAPWSPSQASAKCSAFYPRDAIYQRQTAFQAGYDKIYFSASLAKLFPVGAFTDANQNTIKAGTFDVQFLYTDSADTLIAGCSIQIGEQQTQ